MDEKILYEETGGIRIGRSYWISSNFTYPFAKLRLYKDKLIINYKFGKLTLNKNEIIRLRRYRSIFGFLGAGGIRIYHKKSGYPRFVIFWSFYPEKTITKLKNAKYNIK